MNITNKEALKELKRINSFELNLDIEEYPENERSGRDDVQILVDEITYIIDCFEESGHALNDELNGARKIIRETKNGTVFPLHRSTLKPVYRQSDIVAARNIINEYKRLKNGLKRLNNAGYFG